MFRARFVDVLVHDLVDALVAIRIYEYAVAYLATLSGHSICMGGWPGPPHSCHSREWELMRQAML